MSVSPPVFTSAPLTTAIENSVYTYTITAKDDDGDMMTITAPVLPNWLSFTDNGDATATLTGTPVNTDLGQHTLSLVVTDIHKEKDFQDFTISVSGSEQDDDDDGIPDVWEMEHFGNLSSNTDDDPDGDGLTNIEEFQNGSDPLGFELELWKG